jgi:signal transduction histidine kinase
VPLAGTSDDFDRLAATLNRMLERIALLMESLRQVSSDVAHDLRTPLTRLYQRLEVAREFAKGEPTYEASINAALAEAQGLLDTFSALLRIAQVEGGSPRSRFRLVDLTAVAETVADAYRPDAEQGGRLLISRLALGAFVSGDQELLTQAVANLVENAVRHTPSGTRVDVRLQDHGEAGLVLSVEDDGPGVSKAELPRLTDRFYRAECSRTTPGNGLGLTLVSAIAELHGTTLELSAMSPGFRAAMAFVRSKRLNGAVPHV